VLHGYSFQAALTRLPSDRRDRLISCARVRPSRERLTSMRDVHGCLTRRVAPPTPQQCTLGSLSAREEGLRGVVRWPAHARG
jgi:hypothetical protein